MDLNAAVADALTMLDDRVQATVDVELRLGTLPMVRGNARELGHVVLALITNAVEAIERKGARSRLVLSTFATPDQVTLLVQDTGCGIDEALQPRIFEPFFTTKDDEKAAGLGLHIAREAVKRHGGAISVRSKPGEGTAAKVTLAVSAAVSADADADASSHAAQ